MSVHGWQTPAVRRLHGNRDNRRLMEIAVHLHSFLHDNRPAWSSCRVRIRRREKCRCRRSSRLPTIMDAPRFHMPFAPTTSRFARDLITQLAKSHVGLLEGVEMSENGGQNHCLVPFAKIGIGPEESRNFRPRTALFACLLQSAFLILKRFNSI